MIFDRHVTSNFPASIREVYKVYVKGIRRGIPTMTHPQMIALSWLWLGMVSGERWRELLGCLADVVISAGGLSWHKYVILFIILCQSLIMITIHVPGICCIISIHHQNQLESETSKRDYAESIRCDDDVICDDDFAVTSSRFIYQLNRIFLFCICYVHLLYFII